MWISPNRIKNQVDNLLTERKYARTIKYYRSYRGAGTESAHTLVIVKVSQKIPIQNKIKKDMQNSKKG